MVFYLSLVHIASVIALYYLSSLTWKTLIWGVATYVFAGLGITGGAHRLWAHRSYSAHWTVRALLMIANSMANQGSIFHWVRDHRVHHKFSETTSDPHNALRGFFFAHCGWLLVKKDPAVIRAGRKVPMDDILEDPVAMFQKKLDPAWNLAWCFVIPAIVPWFMWNESLVASFFACCLRYVLVLHATWLVNSVAHAYGYRPYDTSINPRENFWVSFWALGEGWHNWHHKYPYDYATSEFGVLKRVNPTKLFIDVCAWWGLVWDRKRALEAWRLAKLQLEKKGKDVVDTAAILQGSSPLY
eukprot:TRINITY_DN1177_c0_g1_i1.p1 TRINITY_DN1177_c0_g1~~TRINITY_DN1177_c0_g1_i1.p1  ORF type:complete len:338 (+),score=29.11 TRINITY_DN1177_c0_g1_i1:119-1015(+)